MPLNTSTKTYDIFNMDMSFNINDIQLVSQWRERAMTEAKAIHSKPSTARGRMLDEIYETCLYGHAPEQYLIEIKTTEKMAFVPYVLSRCQTDKLDTWRNYPDIVYIFINNKKETEYVHEGTYLWNGNKFKKVSS